MTDAQIEWRVDHDSATSYADQLVAAVRAAVRSQQCRPGEKLPTVRGLAEALSLAPNTVAKAYRALEVSGVIETRGRSGSFIRGDGVERAAREAADDFVRRMRALGVAREASLELVRGVWPDRTP